MGYKRAKKTFRLVFEDPSMEGLEVVATATSMANLLEIERLGTRLESSTDMPAEDAAEFFGRFVELLRSWNLEDDDDKPVPLTVDGLLAQDSDFVLAIIDAYKDAVTGIDDDLGKGSTSGASFPEVSIPMTALPSANHAS
jgi:hypothetical protein